MRADSDVLDLLNRACTAYVRDPDNANVIDAGRGIERILQMVIREFQEDATGRQGTVKIPPDKTLKRLTLPELIEASYAETTGPAKVVPIEIVTKGDARPRLWSTRAALEGVGLATRILSSHSKLEGGGTGRTSDPTREEKFQLLELGVGLAAELGCITAAQLEDLETTVMRKFERVPILKAGEMPVGFDSLPARPFVRLVGRDDELARIRRHLEANKLPISIEGEGGFGKTSLAWAVVESLAKRGSFAAVAWRSGKRRRLTAKGIEDITGYVRGEGALLTDVAKSLRIQISEDLDVLKDDLESFLRRNHTLIVIDNWEDIPDGAREGAKWLAERAKLLITSRPSAGFLTHEKLAPILRKEHLQAIFQNEYRFRIGSEIRLKDDDAARLVRATSGNPLGVWWVVEKIRTGGSLDSALAELEKETHHLLEYCYRNVVALMGPAAKLTARFLVASEGEIAQHDFVHLGIEQEAIDGLRELRDLNLVVGGTDETESVSLTPLCLKYLAETWADDAEQEEASERWRVIQMRLDDREINLRLGPYGSRSYEFYKDAKRSVQGGAVADLSKIRVYCQEAPDDVWGWFYLGMAERQWGGIIEAIEALEKARALIESVDAGEKHGKYPDVLRELALALHRVPDRRKEAIQVLEQARRFSPDSYLELLLADFVCGDRRVPEGLPILMRILRERSAFLTEETIRFAAVRIASFAPRHPRAPSETTRRDVLIEAIDAVEPHVGLFVNARDRQELVRLFFAAARERSMDDERARTFFGRARALAFPGAKVIEGGGENIREVDARDALARLAAQRFPNEPDIVLHAFDAGKDASGTITLARLGNILLNLDAGFTPQAYGKERLLDIILADSRFEIVRDLARGSGAVYVRLQSVTDADGAP